MAHRRRKMGSLLPAALVIGAALSLLWTRITERPVGNRHVPEPMKPVDLDRYLGRWYEFARYDAGFERGCEAVTADYSLRVDGLVRVVNTCREGSPEGRLRSTTGKARVVPGSGNAKLKVSFFGPFFIGNYWVIDHADDYSWSLVGEPSGRYFWILTRVQVPDEATRTTLRRRAAELGYDTGMLRYTQHGASRDALVQG